MVSPMGETSVPTLCDFILLLLCSLSVGVMVLGVLCSGSICFSTVFYLVQKEPFKWYKITITLSVVEGEICD